MKYVSTTKNKAVNPMNNIKEMYLPKTKPTIAKTKAINSTMKAKAKANPMMGLGSKAMTELTAKRTTKKRI